MPIFSTIRLKANAKRLIIFLPILILLSSLTTAHSQLIFAQTSFDLANENYLNQLNNYNNSRDSFITSKANYLAFQTAVAKKNAFERTKIYLSDVNLLITNYLLVVKVFGDQIDWDQSQFDKNDQMATIDEEIRYLELNLEEIEATTSLEQLPPIAAKLKKHIDDTTYPKINKTVAIFNVVKVQSLNSRFNILADTLISFAQKRLNPETLNIISNWESEITNIDKNTNNYINESLSIAESLKVNPNNKIQSRKVLDIVSRAKNEIKKSKNLFEEILRVL